MSEFLSWLLCLASTYSGIVTAVATSLLALFTYFLIRVSRQQSAMLQAQSRAFIFLDGITSELTTLADKAYEGDDSI